MKKNKPKTTVDNKPLETKPHGKINIPLILAALILILALYLYYKDRTVATVNGKPILRAAYNKNMERQVGKQTMDQMIDESLVLQEGLKKGVKIEKSTIDSEIATIEAKIKEQGQTLESALTAEGMTRNDLEKQIEIQKIIEQLSGANKQVTQEEIDKFLTEQKNLLPADLDKDKLKELAEQQIRKNAMITWLENLRKSAKIIYR